MYKYVIRKKEGEKRASSVAFAGPGAGGPGAGGPVQSVKQVLPKAARQARQARQGYREYQ